MIEYSDLAQYYKRVLRGDKAVNNDNDADEESGGRDNRSSGGEFKVILAYLAVSVIWGSTYLVNRIGVSELPPELFSGIRFIIAGLILLVYTVVRKEAFPAGLNGVWQQTVVGLLFQGGIGIVVWTAQWVHSGITSLIVATGPLFIAIIEFLIPGGQKPGIKAWLGLLLGFGGMSFLVLSGKNAASVNIWGAVLLLLASFIWAIGSVYIQRIRSGGSTLANLSIQMLTGGVMLAGIGIGMGEFSKLHFTATGLLVTLYLILFGSIVGYGSYLYVLKSWPATKAGTYAYVNPVVAVILGGIVGEPVSTSMVLSAIIIIGGVILVQMSTSSPSASAVKDKSSLSST